MSNFLDTFLDTEAEGVELPSGEGFASGFIGPVTAAVLWSFWSDTEIEMTEWIEGGEDRIGFQVVKHRSASFTYYFKNKPEAVKAASWVDAYAPGQVWRFELPVADVLNFGVENPEQTWGSTLARDCGIKTWGSAKYRHEFQLIALPAAVQALALRTGALSEPLLNFDMLYEGRVPNPDDPASPFKMGEDAFQAAVIGQGKKAPYEDSLLFQQRAALWAALGEENPKAYRPIGSGTKWDTESKTLSQLLQVVTKPWRRPVWGRLELIPDPRVDATFGEEGEKRGSVPALTAVYADRAAAEKVAAAERPASGSEGATSPALPPVPDDWEGFQEEWQAELAAKKGETDGSLPPKPVLLAIAKAVSATADDVATWWEHV